MQQSLVIFPVGKDFLCIFGGKNESGAVLGDCCFLSPDQQHWTKVCLVTVHVLVHVLVLHQLSGCEMKHFEETQASPVAFI